MELEGGVKRGGLGEEEASRKRSEKGKGFGQKDARAWHEQIRCRERRNTYIVVAGGKRQVRGRRTERGGVCAPKKRYFLRQGSSNFVTSGRQTKETCLQATAAGAEAGGDPRPPAGPPGEWRDPRRRGT